MGYLCLIFANGFFSSSNLDTVFNYIVEEGWFNKVSTIYFLLLKEWLFFLFTWQHSFGTSLLEGKGPNSITFMDSVISCVGFKKDPSLWDLISWHYQVISSMTAWDHRGNCWGLSHFIFNNFLAQYAMKTSGSPSHLSWSFERWPSFLMIYIFVFKFEKIQVYPSNNYTFTCLPKCFLQWKRKKCNQS